MCPVGVVVALRATEKAVVQSKGLGDLCDTPGWMLTYRAVLGNS